MEIIGTDYMLHEKEKIMNYLLQCYNTQQKVLLDFGVEGIDCAVSGLYEMLDWFCETTQYNKNMITIRTGNMRERHHEYNIECTPESWYEVGMIKTWMNNNQVNNNLNPAYQFGNFIGRCTWSRLWIGSYLFDRHRDQTLQSFHSAPQKNYNKEKDHGWTDDLELDYLNQFNYKDWSVMANFLQALPIHIDDPDTIDASDYVINPTNQGVYPIQYPASLNMAKAYYPNIFVDIACETRVFGNNLFLTDKIWRPMASRRPFVLLANRNSLDALKRLGFKTFELWWNEEYDDYECDQRISRMIKVIDNIANMDAHKVLSDMQPVLEHNYNRLKTLTYKQIQETFNA